MILRFFILALTPLYIFCMEEYDLTIITRNATIEYPQLREKFNSPYGQILLLQKYLQNCKTEDKEWAKWRNTITDLKQNIYPNSRLSSWHYELVATQLSVLHRLKEYIEIHFAQENFPTSEKNWPLLGQKTLNSIESAIHSPYTDDFKYTKQSVTKFNQKPLHMDISPNEQRIVIALEESRHYMPNLAVLSLTQDQEKFHSKRRLVHQLSHVYFCDNNKIVCNHNNGSISVFDTIDSIQYKQGFICADNCYNVNIHSLDKDSFIVTTKQSVCVYHIPNEQITFIHKDEGFTKSALTCSSISPNKQYIAAGFGDGTITMWDIVSKNIVHTFNTDITEQKPILHLSLFSDNNRIASAGMDMDNTIKIWDLNTNTCIHTFKRPLEITNLAISADDHYLASSSNDRITLYNIQTGNVTHRINTSKDNKACVRFLKNSTIAYINGDKICMSESTNNLQNMPAPYKPFLELLGKGKARKKK